MVKQLIQISFLIIKYQMFELYCYLAKIKFEENKSNQLKYKMLGSFTFHENSTEKKLDHRR